jgi:hypothetical protein
MVRFSTPHQEPFSSFAGFSGARSSSVRTWLETSILLAMVIT